MARKFGTYGWNRQFKNKPLRRDRWDPFPKDHLPFVDDFSLRAYGLKKAQADAMRGTKRKPKLITPTTFLGKRKPELTVRKIPQAKRQRGSGAKRSLFTNESVALMGTAGLGAAGMARTAAGIAWDNLNARIGAALEQGFATHAAFNESGIPVFDALTESAMVGKVLDEIAEGAARMVPMVEDLLVPLML